MQNRPMAAAASILAAMTIVGFIDQFIQLIADRSSLWSFLVVRTVVIWGLALAWLALRGRRLVVRNWRAVGARSVFISLGLLIYFGALGYMPVAQAAAGLFTAPIWVLIFSVLFFHLPVGPVRVIAALVGFAGVLMVLSPDPSALHWTAFLPLGAGAFYGVGVLATRSWCAGEEPITLALGGFTLMGVLAMLALAGIHAIGPGDDFLTRGWVAPDATVWGVIALQSVGTLIAVVLLTGGYQMAEASYASIFEYSVLGFSAFFGWILMGQGLSPTGFVGLGLIAGSGVLIALRSRQAVSA